MFKSLFIAGCLVVAAVPARAAERVLAFPGAVGGGRYATGGRGGTVYHVTNLNDSGAGSFRDAVSRSNRIVVFDVSGTIELTGAVTCANNVTIAGQTAPGGSGITLKNYKFGMAGDNIICRYISSRPGPSCATSSGNDAWGGAKGSGSIIDHCSISWASDEQWGLYSNNKNYTVQYSVIGPANSWGGHDKGIHGFGIMLGNGGLTFDHNLIIHCVSRNFRGKVPGTETADFTNNVIYDWGYQTAYGTIGHLNYVNNTLKAGNSTTGGYHWINVDSTTTPRNFKIYCAGNRLINRDGSLHSITYDNWSGVTVKDSIGITKDDLYSATSFPITQDGTDVSAVFGVESAEAAYEHVVAFAGNGITSDKRTAIDRQCAYETATGTGSCSGTAAYDASVTDLNKYAIQCGVTYAYPSAVLQKEITDTDNDGMPDEWEIARGLDPNDPSDYNGDYCGQGYMNIEYYLNDLTVDSFPKGVVTRSPTLFHEPVRSVWQGVTESFTDWRNWEEETSQTRNALADGDTAVIDGSVPTQPVIDAPVALSLDCFELGCVAGRTARLTLQGGQMGADDLRIGHSGGCAVVEISGGVITQTVTKAKKEVNIGFGGGSEVRIRQTGGTVYLGEENVSFGRENGRVTYDISGGRLVSLGKEFGLASKVDGNRVAEQAPNTYGEMTISGTAELDLEEFSVGGLWTWDVAGTGVVHQTGGRVSVRHLNIGRGNRPGAGFYTISGGELTIAENLNLSRDFWPNLKTAGDAVFRLSGGTVSVAGIHGGNSCADSLARVVFDGGILRFPRFDSWWTAIADTVETVVARGGLVIDTAGHDITMSNVFKAEPNDGGIVKKGAGTLRLSSVESTVKGPLTVEAGKLVLASVPAFVDRISVAAGATLQLPHDVTVRILENHGTITGGTVKVDPTAADVFVIDGEVELVPEIVKTAAAWYDPNDAATVNVTDEGAVTGLVNKGVAGATLDLEQANGDRKFPISRKPSADLNGLSVISLTNQYGFVSRGTIPFSNDSDFALFVVARRSNADTDFNPFCMAASRNDWETGYWGMSDFYKWYHANGVNVGRSWPSALAKVNNTFISYEVLRSHVVEAGTYGANENRVVLSEPTAPRVADDEALNRYDNHLTYGYRYNVDFKNATDGDLGEALLFDKALTDEEIATINSYLKAKWCGVLDAATEPTDWLGRVEFATANARLDLGGTTRRFASVTGGGRFKNGHVAVTDTITLTVNEDGTIDPLVVDGALAVEGATLEIVNAARLRHRVPVTAIRAGSLTGTFARVVSPEGATLRIKTQETASGIQLQVERPVSFRISIQ